MNKRSGLESRKKIFEAAKRVFARNGYAGANMRAISREAGISVGGVYLYFRNKEDLYLSLTKDQVQQIMDRTDAIVRSARGPAEALSEFLTFHMTYALENRESILSHIRERGFAYAMDVKKRYQAHQVSILERIIRDGISNGVFRKCDPGEIARVIMGFVRGIVLSMAVMNVDVTVRGVHDMILGGITNRKIPVKRGQQR